MPIHPDKHLLLDPRTVATLDGGRLVLGRVTKHEANPLFAEDRPWEVRFDNLYANMEYDPAAGLTRCWYNPFIIDEVTRDTSAEQRKTTVYKPQKREMAICLATSRDGLTWDKPELGIVEFDGHTRNNLVLRNIHGAGVTRDDHDPNIARRYKAFMKEGTAVSPDGLHWSQVAPCPEIEARGDTHNLAFWDAPRARYVGITRLWEDRRRVAGWTTSPDFRTWTKAVPILRPDPDTPHLQPYALLPFRAGRGYLAWLMMFNTETDLVDTELGWSEDTETWTRICPGDPIIPRGPEGAFDWGCVYAAAHPFLRDDKLWLYYGGSDDTHGSWRRAFLGLATLRPDGFAGIRPTKGVAHLTTNPIMCTGSRLRLTADAAGGSVRVAVLDSPDHTLNHCTPITTDATDAELVWASADLSSLQGQQVRLHIELQNATLYTFTFTN